MGLIMKYEVYKQDNNKLDIDIPSEKNIKEVTAYYTALFGYNFRIIRTNAGYHLISKKKYTNKAEWLLDECRILNPFVESCNVPEYIQRVKEFYREQSKTKRKEGITKDKFLDELSNGFRKSGLFFAVGIFDILFSKNVLFRGYHCIRISKKSKDDNPEEIFTFP